MRLPAVLAVLLLVVSGSALAATVPAQPVVTPLAAHRALYSMTLDTSRKTGGDVMAATGTMGYEVLDACDGWATRQRLDMMITNSDGQNIHMVSDYATWESKDGLKFRFHMKQTTDDAVTSQTDGDALLERTGGPGSAHYTSPSDNTKALPSGTLFPMMHTAAIIAAARDSKKFIAVPLFDGTSDSGAEDSSIAILDWQQPRPNKYPMLSDLPSTRVRLAFFDHEPATMIPDYEVGMRYWANGVANDLQMDFGDFVMNATLTQLTPQPHRC